MPHRSFFRCVFVLVILAAIALPGSASATFPGKNGKIAFVQEFFGASKFYARYGGGPNAFGKCVPENT